MDLSAVSTHESGHWTALLDIYNPSHRNLTMYGFMNACVSYPATLALGDHLGVRYEYGS